MLASKKNTRGKSFSPIECPFRATLDLLEGKWKFAIIYSLMKKGTLRFKELEREVGGITPRMLIASLKELEANGIVHRKAYATVPPTVEYRLTDCGRTLEPVIESIRAWGEEHIERQTGRVK
ncbi:MAG: helix-turn-helix transcriptional regulator [Saprospiraceae bacterium]|nr:helix-turn-helix transcriptional regulator [Saprospiraceae bacterium]MCB0545660.1 helix-turn-helix transcriptional regulator [Saprospiraceae bacterium]MCB0576683.1 helix-turn-helix transcriptional regulator [Saprospiraceae bacterium]MCB9308285.1 helix-turn-helix transcriptional regulator [Lewinellaceae bacterium]MCB9355415.1 helix-turn-helix transcriptional regulator [Lewinellaceae bacterium]